MKTFGLYAFRIVTDGKSFKPQRALMFKRWWQRKGLKWEDLTNWGVPRHWADAIIAEQIEREERRSNGWVEVVD